MLRGISVGTVLCSRKSRLSVSMGDGLELSGEARCPIYLRGMLVDPFSAVVEVVSENTQGMGERKLCSISKLIVSENSTECLVSYITIKPPIADGFRSQGEISVLKSR